MGILKDIQSVSRAEPSRAEPSRAEPSRAEPSRAEPSRAEPSRAEPSRIALFIGKRGGSSAPCPARSVPGRLIRIKSQHFMRKSCSKSKKLTGSQLFASIGPVQSEF
ncbi:hypothetical protein FFV09_07130 [Saccharibacillus brassicae]|uniref:Uncharacterized protein n=1 Tax=Saccharibacillus brassicae TaxID=2583377 RepID=A0A4Y6UU51_SACBS|nr:hypothetical protein FFV09_07130 [Saccharibacillus brassicae]